MLETFALECKMMFLVEERKETYLLYVDLSTAAKTSFGAKTLSNQAALPVGFRRAA